MRVLFLSGSFPPNLCGIGDYTWRLGTALADKNVEVGVLTLNGGQTQSGRMRVFSVAEKWGVLEVPRLRGYVKFFRPDIVHLQYPGAGYGHSLGPHFLALSVAMQRLPLVITAHEFKVVHMLRRLSIAALLPWARAVVFTTESERQCAVGFWRKLGWRLERTRVICIGSNLPNLEECIQPDPDLVSYWGMFHRGKGLEQLLSGFRKAFSQHSGLRLQLVGGLRPSDVAYFAELKRTIAQMGLDGHVELRTDCPGEEVVRLLQRSGAVVLPFVDGATFRRGTLVAALKLGLPVITTRGPDTPADLVDGVNIIFADSADEIAEGLVRLRGDVVLRNTISENAKALAGRFSWEAIAAEHVVLYCDILGQK